MARRSDPDRLQQINDCISRQPGVRPAEIAQRLELPRSSITRALPALDDAGYLLSEDNRGRLWPFSGKRER